jgi:hypothetical protein
MGRREEERRKNDYEQEKLLSSNLVVPRSIVDLRHLCSITEAGICWRSPHNWLYLLAINI